MARGGQSPTAVKARHLEVSCQHPRPGSPSSELPLPDTGLKSRSQLGSQPATLNEPTGLPDSPPHQGRCHSPATSPRWKIEATHIGPCPAAHELPADKTRAPQGQTSLTLAGWLPS